MDACANFEETFWRCSCDIAFTRKGKARCHSDLDFWPPEFCQFILLSGHLHRWHACLLKLSFCMSWNGCLKFTQDNVDHLSIISLSELVLIELPFTINPAWTSVSMGEIPWVKYKSACRRRGPVVILHFSLSLWDNELKRDKQDSTGVTLVEETEELQGYNFLNPCVFHVRTLLTLGSRYKHGSRKTFKWNVSNLSHFGSVKLLNDKWQLHSAEFLQGTPFEYLFCAG